MLGLLKKVEKIGKYTTNTDTATAIPALATANTELATAVSELY